MAALEDNRELSQLIEVQAGGAEDGQGPDRPNLDQVLRDYQVVDDEMTDYAPPIGPLPFAMPFFEPKRMTETEAQLLDLLARERFLGQWTFYRIASDDRDRLGKAYATADEYFPQFDAEGNTVPGGDDGHNDAFRHTYLNALLSDRFGEEFASAFTTAHEAVPGNPAPREAMDLYNNELGRRIARENPGASDRELADLVHDAVRGGEAVVLDARGELAYSDEVDVGETGLVTTKETAPGVVRLPRVDAPS